MFGDGVSEQVRAPKGGAAAAPIQRVGAQYRIADWDQADSDRLAADHIVAPPIDQPGHHVDLFGNWCGPAIKIWRGHDELSL